ncbi:MAG: zinc-binding alcohol dehydrogenase [Actinobacteria bacterium]|nr:zinc-binding alcohol dehydrogenase [Actinomycetota bacterium]
MRARAVEFVAPRSVRVTDVDVADPRNDDVVVRTLFSGISSGTETLAFNGDIDPDLELDESIDSLKDTFTFPFRYGYSCVGVVESAVAGLQEGQLVFCLHPHQSVLVRPAPEMVVVDGIDPRLATMLPLVETGLQIALDAAVDRSPVVIIGLGAVGMIAGAVLAQTGVEVVGAEPLRSRRRVAQDFGIEAVAPEDAPSDVPLIIECTGNPRVLARALDLLEHEGTALVASWYGEKEVALPLGRAFHRRRLTITSTQVSSIPQALQDKWTFEKRTARAVELMTQLPLHLLATHTFPLEEAQRAFEAADSAADGLIHAALSYA